MSNSSTWRPWIVASLLATLPAMQLSSASTVAATSPAEEAANDTTDTSSLQEVTVTAQRRSENAQKVPISILAISAATLDTLGAKSLDDLGAVAPSLSFGKTNNQGEAGIRGITDYSRDPGVDSRVGVYVDGVFLGRSWMNNVSLIDIDHIEVLNGPQGTLFGKNTDAGAISIVTRKPSAEASAQTVVDVGNFGYHNVAGYLTGPLAGDGTLAGSLSVSKADSRGYLYNTYYDKSMDGIDHSSARAKLRYTPNDSLEIDLGADWLKARDSTVFYQEQAAGGADPFVYTSPNNDFENNETYGTTATVAYHAANGYSIVNIADFHRASRETNLNGEGNTVPGVPLATVIGDYPEWEHQVSEELRLVSPRYEHFDFVTGLYYFKLKDADNFVLTLGPGVASLGPPFGEYAGYPIHSLAATDTDSYAAFATGNYRFGGGFELTAGVRYTVDKKALQYSMLDQNDVILGYDPSLADKQTFHNVSPKVGLNYHVTDTVMLYASYAEGFKSGGWAADFDTDAQIEAGLRVNPETSRDYEAGMKSVFWNNRLRVNVALFEEKFANYQVFQVRQREAGGEEIQETSLTNAGRVTSKGVELQTALNPLSGLTLTANVTYNDSRFDSFPGGAGVYQGKILDADGAQTPYAPEFKGYVAADIDMPVVHGRADAIFHLDYRAQSKSEADASYVNPATGFESNIPAYATLNGRLGLAPPSERWEVDLWCNNLANKHYWLFAEAPTIGNYRLVEYAPPRAFGVTLKTKF